MVTVEKTKERRVITQLTGQESARKAASFFIIIMSFFWMFVYVLLSRPWARCRRLGERVCPHAAATVRGSQACQARRPDALKKT